jgi:thiamine-monophosphate kinase
MGGIPRYALVSLALPGRTDVEDVASLYRGMIDLAKRFEVVLVGGNMSSAPLISVHVTVLGAAANSDRLLTRSAARPGDKVAVTGHLGAAAAGLEMLSRRMLLDKESTSSLGGAFVRPQPRVAEGRLLVEQGVRTGIDISDGLLPDLRHICEASKVGARIEIARIPVHPAVEANFGSRALEFALGGGEDYEILFTTSDGVIAKVMAAASCPVTVIGEVTADEPGQITLVNAGGKAVRPPGTGWNHFTQKKN